MNETNIVIGPPPMSLMQDGPAEDWYPGGEEFKRYYIELCKLQPDEYWLDIGSGLGRKTIPLVNYLTQGQYHGIDCKQPWVEWCQQNIEPVAPNFRFEHVDVYAPGYNPRGHIRQDEFRFPFDDESFDFVTASSVFTHMMILDIEHYLEEIHRVLKPEGRCMLTWFWWNIDSPQHPSFPFKHSDGGYWLQNESFPEQAIAFDLSVVAKAYARAKLLIRKSYPGTWSGRQGTSHQDFAIATKV